MTRSGANNRGRVLRHSAQGAVDLLTPSELALLTAITAAVRACCTVQPRYSYTVPQLCRCKGLFMAMTASLFLLVGSLVQLLRRLARHVLLSRLGSGS